MQRVSVPGLTVKSQVRAAASDILDQPSVSLDVVELNFKETASVLYQF